MASSSALRRRAHYTGIGVIAFSVIAYQVLLTRLFSVMLYYHFAFVGISLAMLGLTIGAQHVYRHEARFAPARMEAEWVRAALGYSASLAILTVAFLYAPLIPFFATILPLLIGFFIIPFAYGGICVTLTLTKSDAAIGRLYAADLTGASLGCLGIAAILFFLDPITVTFGLAFLAALAAWQMARASNRLVGPSKCAAGLLLILFTLHGVLYLTNEPHFRIVWAKGSAMEKVLFERWNTFSLVRVRKTINVPFGWGFGHENPGPGPEQMALNIDAQAGTVITRFDGKNLEPVSYLADDVTNAAYHLRPIGDVAVIGVGGGRDILSALSFGAGHIIGIELNPSIFYALTGRFGDFSGHLDQRPDVSLVNAEARSWLNQSGRSFDLIQISLIDTWAATAAGGLSLSENRLYTTQSWEDFLDRLKPGGFLSVSRWFDPVEHKGEFYRLLSIAADTLRQRGVPDSAIKQHVVVFGTDNRLSRRFAAEIVTVIVSPDPFTPDELANARAAAEKHNFRIMIAPDTSWDDISRTIIAGQANDRFYAGLPLDFSAPTDDRPFFFYMMRMKDVMGRKNGSRDDTTTSGENNLAVEIVFMLLTVTLLSTLYFTFVPLAKSWNGLKEKRDAVRFLFYFAAIGLGFMLIEISQMQRLMIFLGHPVYGLTVVLFTLLLFGGIGSATIGALTGEKDRPLWIVPIALCAVLTVIGIATPPLTEQFKVYGTALRVLVSIALLAPAGFFMGMMFPLGMTASTPYRNLQPWFWSINGATSVLGSVLGMVISMDRGITNAFWAGAACYLLCAPLVVRRKKERL